MKRALYLTSAVIFLATNLQALTFGDTTGDTFTGAGGGILDITSVEVNNTSVDLIFKINLAGNPSATDWGKYMIGLDTTAGGDTAGNGWGRPISMSSGMDYWIGSWVDSGNGVQLFQYTPPWTQTGGVGTFAGGPPLLGLSISKDASSVTITAPLAALGLVNGSSFFFDVYTSGGGGGDSAVDALANPNQSINDWGVPYNSGSLVDVYTVPEPATAGVFALFGATAFACFIRRRK